MLLDTKHWLSIDVHDLETLCLASKLPTLSCSDTNFDNGQAGYTYGCSKYLTYFNTHSQPEHHVVEVVVQDPVMTDYTRFVISGPDTLIFLSKIIADKRISSKEDEPGLWLEQAEFPLAALPWIVRMIEEKFWRLPSQGGLPNETLHVGATIAGEELRIRHVPKCSDDGEKGIKLQNLSRNAVNGKGNSQSVLLPNKLLQHAGMLQILKNMCNKNNLPYPNVK